jgi:hypothetical protein
VRQLFASRADAVNNGLFRVAVFFDAAPAQRAYNSAVAFLPGISVAGSTLRFVLTRHPKWGSHLRTGKDGAFSSFLGNRSNVLRYKQFCGTGFTVKATEVVLGAGLEPACLSAYAPQTYVSAIPPPERLESDQR